MKRTKESTTNRALNYNSHNNRRDRRGRAERRKWNREEDKQLVLLINNHGTTTWRLVASLLSDQRTAKQCRERWINHLDPGIIKGKLSSEEWNIVVKSQEELGNRWSEIAKLLPGRTPNQIKNVWHAMARRSKEIKQHQQHRKTKRKSSTLITTQSNIDSIDSRDPTTMTVYDNDCESYSDTEDSCDDHNNGDDLLPEHVHSPVTNCQYIQHEEVGEVEDRSCSDHEHEQQRLKKQQQQQQQQPEQQQQQQYKCQYQPPKLHQQPEEKHNTHQTTTKDSLLESIHDFTNTKGYYYYSSLTSPSSSSPSCESSTATTHPPHGSDNHHHDATKWEALVEIALEWYDDLNVGCTTKDGSINHRVPMLFV